MKRRSGFTIIELLIVVSIIAALLLLTIKVMGSFITAARESATEATIHKVNAMIRQRGETQRRLSARKGYLDGQPEAYAAEQVPGLASKRQKHILTHKLIDRRAFPQRYQEVIDTETITGLKLYPTISSATAANSAEILYVFTTQQGVIGDIPAEVDAFSPNEVKDTDQNGLLEFVDGWGSPLRFYRWPTTFLATDEARMKIQNLPTFGGMRDQDDTLGFLAGIANLETTGIPASKFLPAIAGPLFHPAEAYHIPLIVSAGPDGILGLYEPDDTTNNGHLGAIKDKDALLDDIFSAGMKAGGK